MFNWLSIQIITVIPKAPPHVVVGRSIKKSYSIWKDVWNFCFDNKPLKVEKLRLTKNKRADSAEGVNRQEIEDWCNYLLTIGGGLEWLDEEKGTVKIRGW